MARLFLLLLMCGLGLTTREAVGQLLSSAKPAVIEFSSISNISASALGLNIVSSTPQKQDKFLVGCILEPVPSFPGGYDSLVAYLNRNLHYPASMKAEGKVFVEFIIMKTGYIKQVRVSKGINPALDAEALRVVRQMPRWMQPPRQQPMEVSYTLPVTFKHN